MKNKLVQVERASADPHGWQRGCIQCGEWIDDAKERSLNITFSGIDGVRCHDACLEPLVQYLFCRLRDIEGQERQRDIKSLLTRKHPEAE